jgi:hypothetical protein
MAEPQGFFEELLIQMQARLKDQVPEIKYVNQDLGQLEVYTMGSPSVDWPCFLIDFVDTNYNDLLEGEQECELTIHGRLGFNPFSQTSNIQSEDVRRLGLYYYEIENKVHAAFHGWQPLKSDGSALCQPLSRRRAATEKREEDAFRVRGMAFTTGFIDDGAAPVKNVKNPKLNLDAGFGNL